MSNRHIWIIEELEIDGNVGHRQSMAHFDEETGDFVRPDSLGLDGRKEWDRVIGLMSDVSGEDLCHLINPISLMDHCRDVEKGRPIRKRGKIHNQN